MKKLLTSIMAVTVLATGFTGTLAGPAAAQYRDRYYRHRHYDHYDHHGGHGRNTGAILGAGALGLAAGALLGGAASGSYGRRDIYEGRVYNEGPVGYRRVAPVRAYRGYNHYEACAARYRTYDARSDTYVGYDGNAHVCTY